jgi:hypothetical protein
MVKSSFVAPFATTASTVRSRSRLAPAPGQEAVAEAAQSTAISRSRRSPVRCRASSDHDIRDGRRAAA